jgi:hypothetical protein
VISDPLDRQIDDVARALTAGSPAAAFRARVMARLSGSAPHSSRRWTDARVLVPAAAVVLAVVLSAWLLVRPFGTAPPPLSHVDRPDDAAVAASIAPPRRGQDVAGLAPAAPPAVRPRRGGAAAAASSNDAVAAPAGPPPGFESLAAGPLAITPIAAPPIQPIDEIAVGGIAIEPIEVIKPIQIDALNAS